MSKAIEKYMKILIALFDKYLKAKDKKSSINIAMRLIAREEGFKALPYLDTVGVTTFGHGLTYITEKESIAILNERVNNLEETLSGKYGWFDTLTDNRKIVIISMCYQLGLYGFSKFKKTIEFIEKGYYIRAGEEMKDSLAYKQTPQRWDRQIKMFKEG